MRGSNIITDQHKWWIFSESRYGGAIAVAPDTDYYRAIAETKPFDTFAELVVWVGEKTDLNWYWIKSEDQLGETVYMQALCEAGFLENDSSIQVEFSSDSYMEFMQYGIEHDLSIKNPAVNN